MTVICVAIIGEIAMTVTEEMIIIVIVTEEMSVVWREVIPVAVIMMILSRQEPLVASRIRVPAAVRIRVNNSDCSHSAWQKMLSVKGNADYGVSLTSFMTVSDG